MPVNDVRESTGLVVSEYRMRVGRALDRNVSQQEFSGLLCEGVRETPFSRSAIAMWEADEAEPQADFLIELILFHFGDAGAWQFGFAVDCLRVKFPEFFEIVRSGN